MTNLVDVAVARPLPDAPVYALTELYEFTSYTYDSYIAAHGVPPPDFDPKRKIKLWKDDNADTSDPGNMEKYYTLARVQDLQTGAALFVMPCKFVQLNLPSAEAATVNIWGGKKKYDVYDPAETEAQMMATTGPLSGVDKFLLSTLDQANDLNIKLNGSGVKQWQPQGGPGNFNITYPSSETRRVYYFLDSDGQWQWVGFLLRQEAINGAGSPGSWKNIQQADGTNAWFWIAEPIKSDPPPNTLVELMPMRRLYTDPATGKVQEQFIYEMAGQPMLQKL